MKTFFLAVLALAIAAGCSKGPSTQNAETQQKLQGTWVLAGQWFVSKERTQTILPPKHMARPHMRLSADGSYALFKACFRNEPCRMPPDSTGAGGHWALDSLGRLALTIYSTGAPFDLPAKTVTFSRDTLVLTEPMHDDPTAQLREAYVRAD